MSYHLSISILAITLFYVSLLLPAFPFRKKTYRKKINRTEGLCIMILPFSKFLQTCAHLVRSLIQRLNSKQKRLLTINATTIILGIYLFSIFYGLLDIDLSLYIILDFLIFAALLSLMIEKYARYFQKKELVLTISMFSIIFVALSSTVFEASASTYIERLTGVSASNFSPFVELLTYYLTFIYLFIRF